MLVVIKVCIVINSSIATSLLIVNVVLTTWCANSTFCLFRESSGETPLSRMLYASFLLTLLVDGFGSATPNLPFAKVFVQVQMTRYSMQIISTLDQPVQYSGGGPVF